jgi:MATE family multidrug resistance protein
VFVEVAIFGLASSIIATFGPLPLAGHEVALQCAATTFMVPFAISAATSVRVGHAIGRLRARPGEAPEDGPAAAGWAGVMAGGGFMLLCAIVFFTFPEHIARLFTPDRGVIAAAVPLLAIAAGFQFFDGLQTTLTGALRGAGNTTAPFVTQLICFWAIAMPLGAGLAFGLHLGAVGVWTGLASGLGLAALVLLAVWHRTTQRAAWRESPA